jgi:hypothetical protein
MWDCTAISARGVDNLSVPMSPKTKRGKGDPHWDCFNNECTPQELRKSPVKEYANNRHFKLVGGKIACKECDDGVLRTTAGHDMHFRSQHEGLEVYTSFVSDSDTPGGGRQNANVPKGTSPNRRGLLTELKALGVTAKELEYEGYTLDELVKARYTVQEIFAIGKFTLEQMHKAGAVRNMKTAGIQPKTFIEAGYTLAQLRAAGYSCDALKAVGGALAELRAAGFSLRELRLAGFSLQELRDLRRAGSKDDPAFTLHDFKNEGYMCKDLRKVGYTLSDLKNGFTAADLKTVAKAKAKSETEMKGFTLQELKLAGYSAFELRSQGGYSQRDLLSVGFSKGDMAKS